MSKKEKEKEKVDQDPYGTVSMFDADGALKQIRGQQIQNRIKRVANDKMVYHAPHIGNKF